MRITHKYKIYKNIGFTERRKQTNNPFSPLSTKPWNIIIISEFILRNQLRVDTHWVESLVRNGTSRRKESKKKRKFKSERSRARSRVRRRPSPLGQISISIRGCTWFCPEDSAKRAHNGSPPQDE